MTKTYFISGHLDLSNGEFNENYKKLIDIAIMEGHKFVLGDARGCDCLAQKYLSNYAYKKDKSLYDKVTVYHMFDNPRNNFGNFRTVGGFDSDDSRDNAMTINSSHDILWIRSPEEQKKRLGARYNPFHISGTLKNQIRRIELENDT